VTRRKQKQEERAFYVPTGDAKLNIWTVRDDWAETEYLFDDEGVAHRYAQWLRDSQNLPFIPHVSAKRVYTTLKDINR
jgi:hypothetical protein